MGNRNRNKALAAKKIKHQEPKFVRWITPAT